MFHSVTAKVITVFKNATKFSELCMSVEYLEAGTGRVRIRSVKKKYFKQNRWFVIRCIFYIVCIF